MENKKKWVTQLAVFAITFVVAFFVARMIFSKTINQELQEMADGLNAKTPVMVDDETRLDNIKVSGDTLQYDCTLVHVSVKDSTTDIEAAKKFLIEKSQTNLDSSAGMKSFRDKSVSLKYHYRDKDGQDLFKFKIHPTQKK